MIILIQFPSTIADTNTPSADCKALNSTTVSSSFFSNVFSIHQDVNKAGIFFFNAYSTAVSKFTLEYGCQ